MSADVRPALVSPCVALCKCRRRTLRAREGGQPNQFLFKYPLEQSAKDRVVIHSVGECRTYDGEMLNDNLVDLFLRLVGVSSARRVAVGISRSLLYTDVS